MSHCTLVYFRAVTVSHSVAHSKRLSDSFSTLLLVLSARLGSRTTLVLIQLRLVLKLSSHYRNFGNISTRNAIRLTVPSLHLWKPSTLSSISSSSTTHHHCSGKEATNYTMKTTSKSLILKVSHEEIVSKSGG